jgi:hypothetical protein
MCGAPASASRPVVPVAGASGASDALASARPVADGAALRTAFGATAVPPSPEIDGGLAATTGARDACDVAAAKAGATSPVARSAVLAADGVGRGSSRVDARAVVGRVVGALGAAGPGVPAMAASAAGAGVDDAMTVGATRSGGTAGAIATWATAGETCAALFVSGLSTDTADASPRDRRDDADPAAGLLSAGAAAASVDRRCGVADRWNPANRVVSPLGGLGASSPADTTGPASCPAGTAAALPLSVADSADAPTVPDASGVPTVPLSPVVSGAGRAAPGAGMVCPSARARVAAARAVPVSVRGAAALIPGSADSAAGAVAPGAASAGSAAASALWAMYRAMPSARSSGEAGGSGGDAAPAVSPAKALAGAGAGADGAAAAGDAEAPAAGSDPVPAAVTGFPVGGVRAAATS